MQSFGFRVMPSQEGETKVPVAVAGQTMVDIQRILTDIGNTMVRMELRIQNEVPERLVRRFQLDISGGSEGSVGADPLKGSDTLMDDALVRLCRMLDFLGKGVVGTWLDDNYPDHTSRCRLAQDVLDLDRHLEGYTLFYGPSDDQREFGRVDREKLSSYIHEGSCAYDGAMIGMISRDPVRKNRWNISNGVLPSRYLSVPT